jgi:hypothetical protein
MIAEERNVQVVPPVMEEESQINVPPEFKRALREFSDAQAAMDVWIAERCG